MAAVPSIGRASRVEGATAHEADATRALYEQYSGQIFRYCLHQLGSREEAEDAVQSTFLNAFRGLKRGVVPELESAWLFKIAHNVCLSRRRSSWRRGRVESPQDFELVEEFAPAPTRQREELIGFQDVLGGMPENQRRAILLREWQGLSYREISDELDLSQAAVETLIFRARRALAQGLQQAPGEQRSWRARVRSALDLGGAVGAFQGWLAGGAAVKVTAAVVAVTATTVVASSPLTRQQPTRHLRHAQATASHAAHRGSTSAGTAASAAGAPLAASAAAKDARSAVHRTISTFHQRTRPHDPVSSAAPPPATASQTPAPPADAQQTSTPPPAEPPAPQAPGPPTPVQQAPTPAPTPQAPATPTPPAQGRTSDSPPAQGKNDSTPPPTRGSNDKTSGGNSAQSGNGHDPAPPVGRTADNPPSQGQRQGGGGQDNSRGDNRGDSRSQASASPPQIQAGGKDDQSGQANTTSRTAPVPVVPAPTAAAPPAAAQPPSAPTTTTPAPSPPSSGDTSRGNRDDNGHGNGGGDKSGDNGQGNGGHGRHP